MNKGLAHILRDRLTGTPFIDKLAGLVYTYEFQDVVQDENEAPTTYIKKIPVSCDMDLADCDKNDLVPDSSKKGILYFEDRGIVATGSDGRGLLKYRSTLRMVAWINTEWIKNDTCVDASGILMTHCINKINGLQLKTVGHYVNIQVAVQAIPKADKNIFSEYSYDQYVGITMPPFEFFAIDWTIDFLIHPNCISAIEVRTIDEYNEQKNCE